MLLLVLELGHHGDGVLRLRILDVADVQPVEGHEGHLAGELLLVHLLQDLGADLVGGHDVVEEPVAGGDLDGRVDALLALEVLDDEAEVGVGDLRHLAALVAEDLQDFLHGVATVQDRLAGHRSQGLVGLAQVLLERRKALLEVHLLTTQLISFALE